MLADQLKQAQNLASPMRKAMLKREPSVQRFWHENANLLSKAWKAWELNSTQPLPSLDGTLLDANLQEAVKEAWQNPLSETNVQSLWKQITPDVYTCQFFDPQRIGELRAYLEKAWDSQIPLRPPYGIVLNRRGAMLDSRSSGYLAAPSFQAFYQMLINQYMRPIGRLLFPETIGFDTQSFGFSINYKPNTDTSIRPHTDASSVTLNININLPDEKFSGSSVKFYDPTMKEQREVSFQPGTAMIHRGNVPHSALPITSGERTNLVLWLYGDSGQTPTGAQSSAKVDAKQRWTIPTAKADSFAPF